MEKDDILVWSKDYFLQWTDFRAEINTAAFHDSFSYIQYHHTWTVNSEILNGDIYFHISDVQLSTHFLRHLSWTRQQNSSSLLNHEQGHFDLAELMKSSFVEQIKNKFKNIKFPTRGQNDEQRKQFAREKSGLMIANELSQHMKILENLRKKYDEETEYGLNHLKQKKYDEKFKKLRL